jgi:small subunit ribosomal protein S6
LLFPLRKGYIAVRRMNLRGYELMYILDPSLDEDATQALIGQIEDFMTRQGVTVEKTEPWGKRRMAYRIGKYLEGFYVLSHFQAGTGVVAELERKLRVTDGVMRFLTVRIDEEQEKLERQRAKKGITAPSPPEQAERPDSEAIASESREDGAAAAAPESSEVRKETAGAEAPPEESQADTKAEEDKKEEAEPAGEAS